MGSTHHIEWKKTERRWREERRERKVFNDEERSMDQGGVGEGGKYEQNVKNSQLIKMRTVKQLKFKDTKRYYIRT